MPDPFDVYLLAGQSNMTGSAPPGAALALPEPMKLPHRSARIYFAPLDTPGSERLDRPHVRRWSSLAASCGAAPDNYGPELSFGHAMASHTADRRVALVKSDKGGSSLLRDWRPFGVDDPSAFTSLMLRDAADAIEQLLEDGHDARFAGFVWYQGESETRDWNTQPEAYTPAFRALCERIADELNDGRDFDKVIFRVHPHNAAPAPHYESIRSQLASLAEQDPRGAWVDLDDLTYHDQLHLDAPSLLAAGERAAHAMLKLQGIKTPEPRGASPRPAPPAPPVPRAARADGLAPAAPPEKAPALKSEIRNPKSEIKTPARTRILALMNQKGGVGKTTTAVNVGAALANLGLRVLCIDLDPQAHLTLSLGIEPDQIEKSNYELLTDPDTTAMEVVRYTARDDKNLAVLPAETNLAGVESELSDLVRTGLAQTILRNKCRDLMKEFDYVLIDCPPSLGLLTINALTMANQIVVPMQAHFLALQGMTKLFETIGMVRQGINPSLTVAGVVLCMHEGNTLLATEVINELEGFFEKARGTELPWAGGRVFTPPIRRNIKLAEAPSFGQSVHAYAPDSNGARDYVELARSIAAG